MGKLKSQVKRNTRQPLVLAERNYLDSLVDGKSSKKRKKRAQMMLQADEGEHGVEMLWFHPVLHFSDMAVSRKMVDPEQCPGIRFALAGFQRQALGPVRRSGAAAQNSRIFRI